MTSQYEHSSIPATVKKLFNLPGPFLTARDAWAPSKASSLFLLQERIAHVRRTSFKLLAHATQHNIYRSPSQRRSKPSLLFLLLEVEELNLFHGIRSLLLLLLLFTFCWWCCAQWSCQLLLHHCDHRQRTKMANCQSFKKSC